MGGASGVCCRCNRKGLCKGCSCVKAGRPCSGCLPGRLGQCSNSAPALVPSSVTPALRVPPDILVSPVAPVPPVSPAVHVQSAVVSSPISSLNCPASLARPTQESASWQPPSFPPFDISADPSFRWGDLSGIECVQLISECYNEAIHWKTNLFKVPNGRAGDKFIKELSRLFRSYAEGSTLESIALTAAFLLPVLVLQRPSSRLKSKELASHLNRRMTLWADGAFLSLMEEGRTIQLGLTSHQSQSSSSQQSSQRNESIARSFTNLMFAGKVREAIRLLSRNPNSGSLPLNAPAYPDNPSAGTVLDELHLKHPQPGQVIDGSVLLPETPAPDHSPHFIAYEGIDGPLIRSTALRTFGSAGPSGLDSYAWRRLCSSFGSYSDDLCSSLAAVTRRLCSSYVDSQCIQALLSCRLIALNKLPGVRPIGVGETCRRIIGKAVLSVLGRDVLETVGSAQLCAGQKGGCEAAVHALRSSFESESSEAILLVDAKNAFNSLNRRTALLNILHLCPSIARFLINTYRSEVNLYIDGLVLKSSEGITQGDPLGMVMYALASLPLIQSLSHSNTLQVWYADDASSVGKLQDLRNWWDLLLSTGPSYGYFPSAAKTYLLVKKDWVAAANETFGDTGISIESNGRRVLGSPIGSPEFIRESVSNNISDWVSQLELLAEIAVPHPQAAFSAFVHGFSSKWTFLSRTCPGIDDLFQPLENSIRQKFIPSLTGRDPPNDLVRDLLSLPFRYGGLNISNPCIRATSQFQASVLITSPLVTSLVNQPLLSYTNIQSVQSELVSEVSGGNYRNAKQQADELRERLPQDLRRQMECAAEKGASSWLSVLPIQEHNFHLHKSSFRDALCLRYGWEPTGLPTNCVCGKSFTVDHCLSCTHGGYTIMRHNELRDITANLLQKICSDVQVEPPLQPLSGEHLQLRTSNREDGARLDVAATNFWSHDRQRTYFDVKVFNPLAPSNSQPLPTCYRRHEQEKRRRYEQRVREIEYSSFTPLVFNTLGGIGPTASVVFKRISSMIAEKTNQPYHSVIRLIRCKLTFSLLRSTITCLRGSRSLKRKDYSLDAMDADLALAEGRVCP